MNDKQTALQAKFFKGLADQSRLAILQVVMVAPSSVSEISKATKLSQPNTSAHLACLLDCGLVLNEKRGREVLYRASTPEIEALLISAKKILGKYGANIYKCTRY